MTHESEHNADLSVGQDTPSDALRFLSLLYGADAPGWLTIWPLSDKTTSWYPAKRLTIAAKYALSQTHTDEVFFGVGLRAHQLGKYQRGQSADVMAIPGFWIDIDIKHDVHKKTELPETIEQAIALVREAIPLPPTLIIVSGYGIHIYWLFSRAMDFEDDDDRQSAYHLLHRVHATVQGVAKLHGWDVDSTFSLDHVLRLPGTYNRKVPNHLKLVTIVHADDHQRYNPGDFTEHLITVDEILYPTTADAAVGDLSPIDLDTLKLKPWLNKLIQTGHDPDYQGKHPSRSEAHGKATKALMEAGIDDQTIMRVLLDPRYQIGERPREKGHAWLAKDIARIRAKHNWNTSTYPQNGQELPPEDPCPFQPYSLADLQKEDIPQRYWIIDEVIPEGVHLLAGPVGIGKSYWALQLCLAVAHGTQAFSRFDVQQGEALYLSLEDDKLGMNERATTLEEDGAEWPRDLYVVHEAKRLDMGLVKDLSVWLETHSRTRVVIIDVLFNIRAPYQSKADLYTQDYAVAQALKPLAYQHHIAIILLHHCNKQIGPDDPLHAVSGSTGLLAPADVKAVFVRAKGEADIKLYLRGRPIREQWLAFSYKECVWTYLGEAQAVERNQTRQGIVSVLGNASGPMTPKAIADKAGMRRDLVRFTLSRMVQSGEVKCPARGYYTLPHI